MVCGKVENELTSEKARSAALQKQIELLEAKAEATASADTALQELAAEKQRNAALEAAASSFKDTALKELATEKERSAALEAKVNELLAMCKELQASLTSNAGAQVRATFRSSGSGAHVL